MQGADYVIRTPVGLRLDHFLFLQELMGCFGFLEMVTNAGFLTAMERENRAVILSSEMNQLNQFHHFINFHYQFTS